MRPRRLPPALPLLLGWVIWLLVGLRLYLEPPSIFMLGQPAAVSWGAKTEVPFKKSAWVLEAQGVLTPPPQAPTSHASQIVALPDDPEFSMAVFWFAGSQEARPDVRIAMSRWSRRLGSWSEPQWVVTRQQVSQALGKGVLHLGNPVPWVDAQHRLHVWVVGTGLGGWAASRVLHLRQTPSVDPTSSMTLEVVGVLPLGWLWNLSHLVRHAPLALADGGMVLPLHFELGDHFPVFAWFDRDGSFQGMRRVIDVRGVLQPAPVASDSTHWRAFLRNRAPRDQVSVIQTPDAGLHWQAAPPLPLSNLDSSIASLRLPSGEWLMLRNPMERGRSQLVMHQSTDGLEWSLPMTVAEGQEGTEFSYPSMRWHDDRLWVSFTHLRQGIAWQRWRKQPSDKASP